MKNEGYSHINKTDKKIYFYFTLLFCLSSTGFFTPAKVNSSLLIYLYYAIFCFTTIIILSKYKKQYFNSFAVPVLLILFAALLCALNAVYSWNQNMYDSIRGVLPFMSYILFFLLVTFRLEKEEAEKLIVIMGVLFILVFLVSFVIYPKILFGALDEHDESRGFQRIRTNGIGYLFLLSFFSLNEYILKRKILLLFVYLLTVVCIVMSLSRTYIVFSGLFSLIFILKKSSIIVISVVFIICISAFYIVSKMDFYKIMATETNAQTADIKDDIRMQAVDYYLHYFSPNSISKIIGNGEAIGNNPYGRFVEYLQLQRGLYTSDIGYIGLYVKYGILSLIAYLFFIIKTIITPASEEYLYSKYFLIFIFTISIIIDSPFNTNFITSIMLGFYILFLQNKNSIKATQPQDSKSLFNYGKFRHRNTGL